MLINLLQSEEPVPLGCDKNLEVLQKGAWNKEQLLWLTETI